jgi:Fe2+ transport system protein FeoA
VKSTHPQAKLSLNNGTKHVLNKSKCVKKRLRKLFRKAACTPPRLWYTEIQSQQALLEAPTLGKHDLLPLELLEAGQWADVAEVAGEPSWIGRMAELGIRAGSRLRVLQPGSPCLLQLDGNSSRLSLRGDCAMRILVRPLHARV